MNKIRAAAVLSLAIYLIAGPSWASPEDLKQAMQAYQGKQYKEAAALFEKSLAGRKPDARTTYYLALSHFNSGSTARARQLFEYIVKNFPGTAEAGHSEKALGHWGGSKGGEPKAETTAESSGEGDKIQGRYKDKRLVISDTEYKQEYAAIPKKSKIPLRGVSSGKYLVTGVINGQQINFKYTSKWETLLSLEDLKKLRIKAPSGPPDDKNKDEATGKENPSWKSSLVIKVSEITRHVPVTVYTERSESAALGQAFFEDLKREYEGDSMLITKRKETVEKGKQESIRDYQEEFAALPDQTEIRFRPGPQGHMLVDAKINGKPIQCMFDTGASGYFGFNHLREAGLPIPKGKPDDYATGWAGRPVPTWSMTVKATLGGMTREIPVRVAEQFDMRPLLGQEFLRDYHYSIDSSGGRMLLTKKTAMKTPTKEALNSLYDVPCEVENDREYVTLKVGKASCSHVLIDTGASSTIISYPDAQALGIEIPRDAPYLSGGGVGGFITFRQVYLDLSLGPIRKHDFPVNIGGNAGCAIGQNFMSGWRFTVDRERKLLRFFH
ncbi:MAG: aspartyl protease family protein [Cyanobacteria bacterium HKST-UBA02]|nr:aspartyl protease family protein [Cyanobacteria bacterium HKST-UBA02]